MDRERRLGVLVLVLALITIVLMLGPLGTLPTADNTGAEVLDESLER